MISGLAARLRKTRIDILPTAKAGGFLHQPPLRSNRGCCVLHDVRQALLPVCPTVRYVFSISFTVPYIPIAKTRGFTAQPDKENGCHDDAVPYTLDDCKEFDNLPLYIAGEWVKDEFERYHNFYAVFEQDAAL